MAFKYVQNGLSYVAADWALAANTHGYKVGLFSNDITLTNITVKAELIDPTFLGYAGSAALTSWPGLSAIWDGTYYKLVHPSVTFTALGGPISLIYGFYVVILGVTLMWAEKRADGPAMMGLFPGQTYVVAPTMSFRSEF